VLVVPAMALDLADALGTNAHGVYAASLVAQALFHAFVVLCLLRYMLRDEIMTRDELFAAAGLYVLMAFVFAYLYALIEHWQPGAFVINAANNPRRMTRWRDSCTSASRASPASDSARSRRSTIMPARC
jgi:hypothetical protein